VFTCRLTHNWYGIKFIWRVELPGLVCEGRIVEGLVLQWLPCDVILTSILSEKPVPVIALVDVTCEVRCNFATLCRLKNNIKVLDNLNKINKVLTIATEESTPALADFHCGDVYPGWIGFEVLAFVKGGKPGNPEKTRPRARRQPTTGSTHLWYLGPVSRKPRKVFEPLKPFLDHPYLKTEKCIRQKLLVWRELFSILRICE